MGNELYNELFSDYVGFVEFFSASTNDNAEMRAMILKTDKLRYQYCARIRDLKEVWSLITEDKWLYEYAFNVEAKKEVTDKLVGGNYIFGLCFKAIKKNAKLRHQLRDSKWACAYCCSIKDCPDVAKYITEPMDRAVYFVIRNRPAEEKQWLELCRLFPVLDRGTAKKKRREVVAALAGIAWHYKQYGPRCRKVYHYAIPDDTPAPF